MEAFEVELDGQLLRFFPGARVRDLAGRLSEERRQAFEQGRLAIADAWGNRLGGDGALHPGARYQLVETGLSGHFFQ